MNTRIKKKKYNKWEMERNYDVTISFEEASFVCIAFVAQSRITDFQKFATSRNAMRAVKSYCKKNVWKSGKCDNINDMYRFMCDEIRAEKRYRKFIAENLSVEDVVRRNSYLGNDRKCMGYV